MALLAIVIGLIDKLDNLHAVVYFAGLDEPNRVLICSDKLFNALGILFEYRQVHALIASHLHPIRLHL